MQPTEAQRLAAFITKVARPATPELQREYDHWMKRLNGARS